MNVFFLSPGHHAFLAHAEQGLRDLVSADMGSLADHLGGTSGDPAGVDAARRAAASLGALVAVEERLAALGALRADHERTQSCGLPRSARDHAIRADVEAGRPVTAIAAEVGLSTARIYQIVGRRR
ncbi:hypothetical protein OG323_06300 [Streptomyces cyaneofuscatus]|uniref:hypothetical protein n=1 Tax=Streptomyces cyaneofuscatus TaxID=66883 RepID=UPI0038706B8E|nr:hypothetical protein OG323_06300 [Streptomyces cyaneofuscatus]